MKVGVFYLIDYCNLHNSVFVFFNHGELMIYTIGEIYYNEGVKLNQLPRKFAEK